MKKILMAILSFVALGGFVLTPSIVFAQDSPAEQIKDGVTGVGGEGEDDLPGQIETIVNILLFILGAIAVIMIIFGGIRFATANGDQSAVTSAKNTILYAVIGLIVAILAYAIVNFVIDAFI